MFHRKVEKRVSKTRMGGKKFVNSEWIYVCKFFTPLIRYFLSTKLNSDQENLLFSSGCRVQVGSFWLRYKLNEDAQLKFLLHRHGFFVLYCVVCPILICLPSLPSFFPLAPEVRFAQHDYVMNGETIAVVRRESIS